MKSIKKKYRERLLVREEQWPPISGEKLINLQLVEADKKEGFRGGLPQHGAGGEKIKRTPILYDDLFRVEEGKKPVRKVLVEGNGGMGKTTLCTMLSEGWAEDKMLTQFDCVLLLPLREQSVVQAESLPGLFKLLHSSENIRTSVVSELEESEGEKVLIIADGWDELEESKRSEKSFLYKLFFGDVLPFASVLLTSRPSASALLHSLPSVDRLVEVVGFNQEDIKQYIESEFEKCPEKAPGLIEQLDNNPLIQNVCTVPLNCAITCNLWHTLDQELPSTLTELYTQIILNVILRDVKKKFPDFPIGLSLSNFDSIPSQLEPFWWLTCKFAFEALSNDQLVFTEEELASFFPEGLDSSQKILCFGLLQSARSLLPVGHGLSFHFLHLTFQEYLAALHVVTLPTEEQLEVVRTNGKSSRFATVWRFFFGLGSKKQGSCIGQVSRKVVCLDANLVDTFLSLSDGKSRPLFPVDRGLKILKCHCALESVNDSMSSKAAKNIDGQFGYSNKTPHDCVAVLHVLSHTSHCRSVRIDLSGCGLSDKLLKRLTDLLFSASGELKVVELHLGNNKLTSNGISDLFTRASAAFSSLEQLSLKNNSIDGDGVNSIVTSLMHTSCKSLIVLSLSHNPLGVSGMQALERAVISGEIVNLQCLFLSNTLTDDADINAALITTCLRPITSHCPHLRYLDLSENNLGVPGAVALGEALPLLTDDIFLYLNNTMLDSEAIIAFTDCVKKSVPISNESLIQPKGSWSQSDGSCSSSSGKLERLDLSGNNIDDDGVAAFLEQVPHLFTSLERVYLDRNLVSDGMVERLEECLKINKEVSCYSVEQWMCFLVLNTVCASYLFSNVIVTVVSIHCTCIICVRSRIKLLIPYQLLILVCVDRHVMSFYIVLIMYEEFNRS